MQNYKSKLKILTILFFLFLGFFGLAEISLAATYYVDQNHPQANDSNSGTENLPWKTIQKAADIAIAGDTVYVKSGTYYQDGKCGIDGYSSKCGILISRSGISGNPIVFKVFPYHRVTIDGGGTYWGFFLYRNDYVVIDGFEIKNVHNAGVRVEGDVTNVSTNITIQNNYIHHVSDIDNCGCVFVNIADYLTFYNNTCHNVIVNGDMSNQNAAGFISFYLSNGIIKNNTIYNVGSGIRQKYPQGNNIDISFNYVYNIGRWGIVVGPNATFTTTNNKLHNNIVYNAGYGIYIQVSDSSSGIEIYSNTVLNSTTGIFLEKSPNTIIKNNIIFNNDYSRQVGTYTETLTMRYQRGSQDISESDYNLFYHIFSWDPIEWAGKYYNLQEAIAYTNTELHSIQQIPTFKLLGKNFHLSFDSYGKGAGENGIDIGAYTYGNEIIGSTLETPFDTTPPAAPTGVIVQ